jgi:predicted flavoprotein YhiN
VLQISSYWKPGTPLQINLLPGVDLAEVLAQAKLHSRKLVANELAAHLPARLADAWVGRMPELQRPINEASDKALARLAEQLSRWEITPTGTEGYKKAEVTLGGVDTKVLSQQTMECKSRPGLYFIGEVVDITGWLGATTSSGPGPVPPPAPRPWRKSSQSWLERLEPKRQPP